MRLFVTHKDIEDAQKEAQEKIRARNKAMALIEDAKARYVKEKTRARSKKAALEKDALLSSPKFKDLELYEKRQDIIEAYGFDCITMEESDRLEALWDEREAIRNRVEDGVYQDDVTRALHEAYMTCVDLYEDRIEYAKKLEENAYKYIDTETWEEVYEGQQKQVESEQDSPL
jgi:hypothetical protein